MKNSGILIKSQNIKVETDAVRLAAIQAVTVMLNESVFIFTANTHT